MSAITVGTVGRRVSRATVALALAAVLAVGLGVGAVAGRATAPPASGRTITSSGSVFSREELDSPGRQVRMQVMRKVNHLGG